MGSVFIEERGKITGVGHNLEMIWQSFILKALFDERQVNHQHPMSTHSHPSRDQLTMGERRFGLIVHMRYSLRIWGGVAALCRLFED